MGTIGRRRRDCARFRTGLIPGSRSTTFYRNERRSRPLGRSSIGLFSTPSGGAASDNDANCYASHYSVRHRIRQRDCVRVADIAGGAAVFARSPGFAEGAGFSATCRIAARARGGGRASAESLDSPRASRTKKRCLRSRIDRDGRSSPGIVVVSAFTSFSRHNIRSVARSRAPNVVPMSAGVTPASHGIRRSK